MRDAIRRLKDIVSSKDILPILQHYIHRDGKLYASNGIVTACVPCDTEPGLDRFAVRASELQRFLDRTDGEPRISVEQGLVRVACGKRKAQFPGLVLEDTAFDKDPVTDGQTIELPDNFADLISAVRPFVSDNATKPFATCLCFRGDKVYATSNVAVAGGSSGISVAGRDFLLSYTVADYLIKHSKGLQQLTIRENRSAYFVWSDSSWLAASGMDTPYPAIEGILATVGKPEWEIPKTWKDELSEVTSLGNREEVDLYADKIISRSDTGARYESELETPVFPDGLVAFQFMPKYLSQVFDAATHLEIAVVAPKVHVRFRNEYITGVGLAAKI